MPATVLVVEDERKLRELVRSLVDAGPHPNKAHAVWGRRAQRLEPDPLTAPVVRWMFAQRRAGHSLARITRALNDAGIPRPSAADPGRNTHRAGQAWTLCGVDVSPPVSDEDVIAYLRAREITLIYDPVTGTLQADSPEAVATVIGRAS